MLAQAAEAIRMAWRPGSSGDGGSLAMLCADAGRLYLWDRRAAHIVVRALDADGDDDAQTDAQTEHRINAAALHKRPPTAAAVAPHSATLVVASDDALSCWKLPASAGATVYAAAGAMPPASTTRPLAVLPNAWGRVAAVALSGDERAAAFLVAPDGAGGGECDLVVVAQLPALQPHAVVELGVPAVQCLLYAAPRGAAAAAAVVEMALVVVLVDKTFQVRDANSPESVLFQSHMISASELASACVHASSGTILFASADARLHLYELPRPQPAQGRWAGARLLRRWDLDAIWAKAAGAPAPAGAVAPLAVACWVDPAAGWNHYAVACDVGVLVLGCAALEVEAAAGWGDGDGEDDGDEVELAREVVVAAGVLLAVTDDRGRRLRGVRLRPPAGQAGAPADAAAATGGLVRAVRGAVAARCAPGRWRDRAEREFVGAFAAAGVRSVDEAAFAAAGLLRRLPVPAVVRGAVLPPPTGSGGGGSGKGAAAGGPQPRGSAGATTAAAAALDKKAPAKKKSSGPSLDKPITFHTKIKSSGYGEAKTSPQRKERGGNVACGPGAAAGRGGGPVAAAAAAAAAAEQPWEIWGRCRLAESTTAQNRGECQLAGAAVTALRVSEDVDGPPRVAVGTAGKSVVVLRDAIHKEPVRIYASHDAPIQSVDWSSSGGGAAKPDSGGGSGASRRRRPCGRMLLSCATDGVGRLWSADSAEPLLFIDGDRRILGASGRSVLVIGYRVSAPDPARAEPALHSAHNAYRVAGATDVAAAVTAVAALGGSGTGGWSAAAVGCGGALLLVDVAAGAVLRRSRDDAHARSVYRIMTSPQLPSLAFTAALSDGIKCFDFRVAAGGGSGGGGELRPVLHLLGHVNRHARIHSALSPCGRYVAAGSEDRCVYVYDVRFARAAAGGGAGADGGGGGGGGGGFAAGNRGVLQCFRGGFGDAVTAVAFHPRKPLLYAGGQSGVVKAFSLETAGGDAGVAVDDGFQRLAAAREA
ncbi:hypothetical protein DFJ73DRAFT_937839 [Zopfochytrium polystomum]|nr:hypothetical protein DFJ73DRAFT_937839 [Zopfochytrium polystomum]